MSFEERRYRRYFEKADYGKFRNSIYDFVNRMFGFCRLLFLGTKLEKD